MNSYSSGSFALRPFLKVAGILALTLVIGTYVVYQARNLLQGPTITLSGPVSTVQHEKIIVLEGTAKNIVKLTLNGKEIHTSAAGDFSQELVLENGYTIVLLEAQDRFGRSTEVTQEYVYVPEEFPAPGGV